MYESLTNLRNKYIITYLNSILSYDVAQQWWPAAQLCRCKTTLQTSTRWIAETEMVLTHFHKANALICVRMYLTLLCRDISNVYPQFMYAIWHVSHVEKGCFQYVSTAKEWGYHFNST